MVLTNLSQMISWMSFWKLLVMRNTFASVVPELERREGSLRLGIMCASLWGTFRSSVQTRGGMWYLLLWIDFRLRICIYPSRHSSLRQADLNKHMKICKCPAATLSPTVIWDIQHVESSAPGLSASASLALQEQTTAVDPSPLLNITNAGEDAMDSYLAFPPFGGEFEAGICGVE